MSYLVETGTFKGDTIAEMLPFFDKLVTVEYSETFWREAAIRFSKEPKVHLYHGNSADILKEICTTKGNAPTLYWLDAHWCVADNIAGERSQCPLLQELAAIGSLEKESVILIDDARLFLAPPPAPHDITQWPSLDQIVTMLRSLSQQHELMVINDVIAFIPLIARSSMIDYARACGVDWLRASQSLTENALLRQSLEEKERVIQDIVAIRKDLLEKERVIVQQSNIIKAYRLAYGYLPLLKHMARFIRRLTEILRPRLGNLCQYSPKALTIERAFNGPLENTPNISIVTPSFGQGDYIENTLQSVLNQGYPNLEYFVQDGGSTDQTVDILKAYEKDLSGWSSEQDNGQSNAINLGFSRTTGEIMAWLNSDDLLLPGALAYVADYFNRHPDVDVIYGNRLLIDENDMEIGRWILPGHDSEVLSWVDYVPQETLYWRRRIWDKTGGKIDESFSFAMDWDLLVRFRDAGARFAHIPRFLGAFRIHQHQKTSSVINEVGLEEMNKIRKRVLGHIPSPIDIRKATTPYLFKHIAVDMAYRIKTRVGGSK